MKTPLFIGMALLCLLTGCDKAFEVLVEKATSTPKGDASGFTQYTIKKGEHSTDKSTYRPLDLTEQSFVVRFDSSAIYKTASAENQYDINKLWGFSDNGGEHHQYSARFGWRWSEGALRLFAYVYNAGKVSSRELATVAIGSETACAIKVTAEGYLFSVNGVTTPMPRAATTLTARGYQLYPYFGGDETAPHDVKIWVKQRL